MWQRWVHVVFLLFFFPSCGFQISFHRAGLCSEKNSRDILQLPVHKLLQIELMLSFSSRRVFGMLNDQWCFQGKKLWQVLIKQRKGCRGFWSEGMDLPCTWNKYIPRLNRGQTKLWQSRVKYITVICLNNQTNDSNCTLVFFGPSPWQSD